MKRKSTVKTIETPVEDLIINVVSEPAMRDPMGRNLPEVHKASLRTTIPNATKVIANAFTTSDPDEFYLDLAGLGSTMKGAIAKLGAQIKGGVARAEEELARIEGKRTLSPNDDRRMAMLEQRLQLLHDYLYAIGRM